MIGEATQRRAFFATGLALAALAWALLAVWAGSPWGRYLEHGDWTRLGLVGALCAALPGGAALVPGALYVGGWVLMLAAMMLPTALPVLYLVERMTGRRGGWCCWRPPGISRPGRGSGSRRIWRTWCWRPGCGSRRG